MSTFPSALYVHTTLVDNTDDVLATHPNTLAAEIEALEAKVGITSSGVTTSHDYKLTHLPAQLANSDLGSVEIRAQTFYADAAAGTAPLTIVSNTMVVNLNADLLDGIQGSGYVQTTGVQTVNGAKTFSIIPTLPAADPVNANDAVRKSYVDSQGFLSGDIVSTVRSTSTRTGWLLCDGSAISRTSYSALFAAIGTTYGSGDNSTSFNVPNFTNKFMRGNTLVSSGGDDDHIHYVFPTIQQAPATAGGVFSEGPPPAGFPTTNVENIPAYVGVKFWIKT